MQLKKKERIALFKVLHQPRDCRFYVLDKLSRNVCLRPVPYILEKGHRKILIFSKCLGVCQYFEPKQKRKENTQ